MSVIEIIATVLMFITVGLVSVILSRFIKLPLPLLMVFCGFGYSFLLPIIGWDTGVRADNFEDLMFYVLLPILIFEAAFNIKLTILKMYLISISIMATFGILLSTVIAGYLIFYGIGHPVGFPLIAALLTAAIISATDPAAIVNELKSLNAPGRLTTIIEGESLFNDAAAIVLFGILLSIAQGLSQPTIGQGVFEFLTIFFGGIILGLSTGFIAILVQKIIGKKAVLQSFLTIGLAYGSFYLAEHILDVSGVMAVLSAALLYRNKAALDECDDIKSVNTIWELLSFICNMLVFVLLGLVISVDMFEERWLAMLIGIGAITVARLVTVYTCVGVAHLAGNQIKKRYPPIIIWGGLKGAVTIALVLSLPTELDYWWTIQSIAFGVVLFSLIAQATTAGLLCRILGFQTKPLSSTTQKS